MTWKRLLAFVLAFALVAAACGDDDDSADDDTTTAAGDTGGDLGSLSGNIEISGSSTVEPISNLVAEAFVGAGASGVGIRVEGPGTGDGFKRFCAGETDISDASRAIKDVEAEDCAAAGIEYIELKVANDGLSVLTNIANDAVSCLGLADLYALLGPESEGFDTWDAADGLAAEVGGPNAPYPAADLIITAPGEESGTYDTFVEFVIEGDAGGEDYTETRGVEGATRADYTASANDNTIITGITGSDTSLGWVGYAFFVANQGQVKALEVDAGDGCVVPTADTIASAEYPLSRPLFIYVNKEKADSNSALASFVDFYVSDAGLAAVDGAGYVRLPDSEYETVRGVWESRTTGTN